MALFRRAAASLLPRLQRFQSTAAAPLATFQPVDAALTEPYKRTGGSMYELSMGKVFYTTRRRRRREEKRRSLFKPSVARVHRFGMGYVSVCVCMLIWRGCGVAGLHNGALHFTKFLYNVFISLHVIACFFAFFRLLILPHNPKNERHL